MLWLICGCSVTATLTMNLLVVHDALFDKQHRLKLSNISKKDKVDIDVSLYRLIHQIGQWSMVSMKQITLPLNKRASRKGGYEMVPMGVANASADIEFAEDSTTDIEKPPPTYCCYSIESVSSSLETTMTTDTPSPLEDLLFIEGYNVHCGEKVMFEPKENGGLHITVKKGERIALVGPSGVGKTRLLRALAQLDAPAAGTMTMNVAKSKVVGTGVGTGAGAGTVNQIKSHGLGMVVPLWRKRCMYLP